jgi:hypothetical protein
MTTAPAVLTVHDPPSWLRLTCPYREDLVQVLKSKIPSELRRWDDELKAWLIHRDYESMVAHLLRGLFPEVYLIDGHQWTDVHSGRSWEQLRLFDGPAD